MSNGNNIIYHGMPIEIEAVTVKYAQRNPEEHQGYINAPKETLTATMWHNDEIGKLCATFKTQGWTVDCEAQEFETLYAHLSEAYVAALNPKH